jgi:DNA-binding response OmpR family regulator
MMARILLADDEADILEPVSYALEQHGFEVTCVEDGDAALARARSGEFDLLLCDVMMPGTLGTDVCRILRAEGDLPIILLTAKDAEVDRVLGLELGADDYITKPFSTSEL